MHGWNKCHNLRATRAILLALELWLTFSIIYQRKSKWSKSFDIYRDDKQTTIFQIFVHSDIDWKKSHITVSILWNFVLPTGLKIVYCFCEVPTFFTPHKTFYIFIHSLKHTLCIYFQAYRHLRLYIFSYVTDWLTDLVRFLIECFVK